MSKAMVVVDFAYKGPDRKGYGTGHKGLKSTLQYLQYRDRVQNNLAKDSNYERWRDHGMGIHWREILNNSEELKSKHVLAWTWVVSPSPELMQLVPEAKRRDLLCELTERVVEDYYIERGFDLPEYSFVLHDKKTQETGLQQLHTHVILPGTVSSVAERLPVYNNKERGHDALFREVATRNFTDLLDELAIPDWRQKQAALEEKQLPEIDDLDEWFR